MTISGNRAFARVREQFTPPCAARSGCGSARSGQSSVARHHELIRLRAVGDAQRAAAADNSWHSLPAAVEPIVEHGGPVTPPSAED